METPSNVIAGLWIALAPIGLVSMFSVAIVSKWRRHQWVFATQRLENAASVKIQDHIRRTKHAQEATNFLDSLLRCIYYFITVFSAFFGTALLFMTLESNLQFRFWLVSTGTTWAGALVLTTHWRGWDDDQKSKMHRKLRRAQERALSQCGVVAYDKLTPTYTPEFWLRTLEHQMRRTFRGVTPITCLAIRVEGLAELRNLRGDEIADQILARVGQEIRNNVRSSDIVCRYQDQTFAISLLRCPSECGSLVAKRVVNNVTHVVVEWANLHYGNYLHLRSELTSMPREAMTPVQLLRASEHSFKKKRQQLNQNKKGDVIGVPLPC